VLIRCDTPTARQWISSARAPHKIGPTPFGRPLKGLRLQSFVRDKTPTRGADEFMPSARRAAVRFVASRLTEPRRRRELCRIADGLADAG